MKTQKHFLILMVILFTMACDSNPEREADDTKNTSEAFVSDTQNKTNETDNLSEAEPSSDQNKGIQAANCVDFSATTEDIIDLQPFIRSRQTAVTERQDFGNYFRWVDESENNAKKPFSAYPIKLNMANILFMYNAVKNQAANIRGLKFSLGYNGGNEVKLMLTNVVMKCSKLQNPANANYTYTPVENGTSYICNGNGTMSSINVNDLNNFCSLYWPEVLIKHKSNDPDYTPMDYYPASDKNDTKEIFFTYQELFYYYHLNYQCNGGTNNYDQDLYIYNGSAPLKIEGADYNKHTMFISAYDLDSKSAPKKLVVLVVGDVANLGHLCPPSCYPVYKILTKKTCLNP